MSCGFSTLLVVGSDQLLIGKRVNIHMDIHCKPPNWGLGRQS